MKDWMKLVLLGLFSSALIGCGGDGNDNGNGDDRAQKTQLRVLHGVADAPPVDVLIDGGVVLSNVAYRQGSGYLSVQPGSREIRVNPTGQQTSVIEATPDLAKNTAYSLLALGSVGDQNIEPLLLEDDTTAPAAGNIRVRVVHGAPTAPAVDIYITEPGTGLADTAPTLGNVSYKDASQFLEVPAGTYQIRVAQAGQAGVPAIYDSGPVSLQEGTVLTAVALPTPGNTGSIGLVAMSNNKQNPVFPLANVQETRIRAVHAVPNAPPVDLLVADSVVASNLAFTEATGYLNTIGGSPRIQVNPAGTADSVIDTTSATLEASLPYTIIALGSLPNVQPLVLQDQTVTPRAGDVQLRVVHAAEAAPAVDVYVTAPDTNLTQATPTVSNVSFTNASDYLTVQPGEYRIRITPTGDQTVVYDSGRLTLNAGEVLTAVAIPATGGTSPVSLLALTNSPTRASFTIPDVNARVRAVHASPDATAGDVLIDGEVAFSGLTFGEVSEYTQVMPSDGPMFTVTAAGTNTTILETSPPLMRGTDYTLMAVNFLDEIEPLVLAEDRTPPQPGNAKVRLVHVSPTAPAVDILIDGETVASDVSFKDSTEYLQLPAGDHTVAIRIALNNSDLFKTDVTVAEGGIFTIAAIGRATQLQALVLSEN